MAELGGTWWSSAGTGPAVVVPRLNVDWAAVDLAALTYEHRVVVVAPRGFGPSQHLRSYDVATMVADVERVVDHLGIETYATLGYSMNGAMAAVLADASPRVTAAAVGGFPLTADLRRMGDRARSRHMAARADPARWDDVRSTYDPRATETFWDHVASGRPGALADLPCPLRLWWGDQDAVVGSLQDLDDLARECAARGLPYGVVPGLDHDTALARIGEVLPRVSAWLTAAAATRPGAGSPPRERPGPTARR